MRVRASPVVQAPVAGSARVLRPMPSARRGLTIIAPVSSSYSFAEDDEHTQLHRVGHQAFQLRVLVGRARLCAGWSVR